MGVIPFLVWFLVVGLLFVTHSRKFGTKFLEIFRNNRIFDHEFHGSKRMPHPLRRTLRPVTVTTGQ